MQFMVNFNLLDVGHCTDVSPSQFTTDSYNFPEDKNLAKTPTTHVAELIFNVQSRYSHIDSSNDRCFNYSDKRFV